MNPPSLSILMLKLPQFDLATWIELFDPDVKSGQIQLKLECWLAVYCVFFYTLFIEDVPFHCPFGKGALILLTG